MHRTAAIVFLTALATVPRAGGQVSAGFGPEAWPEVDGSFAVTPVAAPHIAEVYARTSLPRDELTLDVMLSGPVTGEVSFVASFLTDRGAVMRRFETRAAPTNGVSCRLVWTWYRPPLWDLHDLQPLSLRLEASAGEWSDRIEQAFGFRDLRIEGREIKLNGTSLRLRTALARRPLPHTDGEIEKHIQAWRQLGFNAAMVPFGEQFVLERWAVVADRTGFVLLIGLPALPARDDVYATWPPPGWVATATAAVGALRCHPSILMWWLDGSSLAWEDDLHPLRLGREAREPLPQGWRTSAAAWGRLAQLVKDLDPDRPVIVRGGGPVGDVYAVDTQLGFHPLQERLAWLSAWAEEATIPLAAPAFGTPRDVAFSRGRRNAAAARADEPWITEYGAAYLGEWAYQRETATYRARLAARDRLRSLGLHVPPIESLLEPGIAPVFQDLQSLFIRATWPSWRTWGISGGIMPLDDAYAWGPPLSSGEPTLQPAGEALRDVNRETLAWIAGPPDAWTARDHHFTASETVSKQIVLINDGRVPRSFRYRCDVILDGERLRRVEGAGRLGPGETQREPLTFTLPELWLRADGKIQLEADIGNEVHTETSLFRGYPHQVWGQPEPAVLVFDPEGDTTRFLGRIGVSTERWDGAPAGERVLVVGRNALHRNRRAPGSLEAFLAGGGRLIISAHDPAWLRDHLGLRVSPHVARRVWPVASQRRSFALANYDDRAFRDWRGAGSLIPPSDPLNDAAAPSGRGWRWGNRGSVSSAMIEKPHFGGWTPLLEGGFDLAFSPLLELRRGPGLILLSTLDLEARSTPDPVADGLMQQILNYVARTEGRPPPPDAVYVGGPRGRALLDEMGFIYRVAERITSDTRLVVVDGDTTLSPSMIEDHVEEGGLVVMLAPWPDRLPFELKRAERTLGRYAPLVNGEICPGLSVSDLHTRMDVEGEVAQGEWLVTLGNGVVSRMFYGQRGELWLVALTPAMLDEDEDGYQRFSRWRLVRTLSQVLGNLGGRFEVDRRIFAWEETGREPIPLFLGWRTHVGEVNPREPDDVSWAYYGMFDGPAPYWPGPASGGLWLRRDITLPAAWAGADAVLELGPGLGIRNIFMNGSDLAMDDAGADGIRCRLAARLLKPGGRNTLLVYATNLGEGAGLTGQPDQLRLYIEGEPDSARWYVPGYRTDLERGDDPSRHARWDD